MKRHIAIAILIVMVFAIPNVFGQDIVKKRIFFLYPIKVDALVELEQGVRKTLGEEQYEFEVLSAQGQSTQFIPIVKAALRKNPDLLVCIGTQVSQTALGPAIPAEERPPIVFTAVTNPEDVLDKSQLATPRQLPVTGISDTPVDITPQTLHLIKTFLPKAKRIGMPYNHNEANSVSSAKNLKEKASEYGFTFDEVDLTSEASILPATQALLRRGVDAVLIIKDRFAVSGASTIVKACLQYLEEKKRSVPVFAMDAGSVTLEENGAVAAASAEYFDIGVATAEVVRKILFENVRPQDIPISGPEKSTIFINLTSASRFGIKNPTESFPEAKVFGEPVVSTETEVAKESRFPVFWVVLAGVVVIIIVVFFIVRKRPAAQG